MTAQAQCVTKTFEDMFESFKRATEFTLQMQQELFKTWPGFPEPPSTPADQVKTARQEWLHALQDLAKNYQEMWERQYKAGLESLEGAFEVASAKDPTELHEKLVELWEKSFHSLKELTQSQMKHFQAAVEKGMQWAKKAKP
jgi:hypothetical protein